MVMKGKFKLHLYSDDFAPKDSFWGLVEVKFKDASISYYQEFNDDGGMNKTISFIARDKKTLKRLQNFIETDLFVSILRKELGGSGSFEYVTK